MIVLHAGFCDDRLFLWGEVPRDRGVQHVGAPSSGDALPPLPYSATAEALTEPLAEAAVRLDPEQPTSLAAWLPTVSGLPLPSSPLIADLPSDGAGSELVAWCITALPLSAGDAINLLSACVGREMLGPGRLLGGDVVFWTGVLRFAVALVVREQFLPGLLEQQGAWSARWEPVFIGDDAGRLVPASVLYLEGVIHRGAHRDGC